VDVPYSSELEPGKGAFSAAAWIRTDDPSRRQDIASGPDSNNNFYDGWEFRVSNDDSGRLFVGLSDRGSPNIMMVTGSTVLAAKTWYYVAFTYDGTANPDAVTI
jgi:hypothetical protein